MSKRLTNQQAMSAMFEIAKCLHRSGWLDEVQVDMDSVLRFIQQSPWITDRSPNAKCESRVDIALVMYHGKPVLMQMNMLYLHWLEGKRLLWMPIPPLPEVKE
jgi:hypothetical protein